MKEVEGEGGGASAGEQWLALLRAPRALGVIYVAKLLLSFSHFTAGIILTLWLSSELGFSDAEAGVVFGVTGLFGTVWGVLAGAWIDKAGVRRSLLLGTLLAAVARLALLRVRRKVPALVVLWLLHPLADALGIPVMTIGIKRCVARCDVDCGTMAYGVFYSVQNVAAVLAGLSVDLVRRNIAHIKPVLALLGGPPTAYRAVFLAGGVTALAAMLLVAVALDELDHGMPHVLSTVTILGAISDVSKQARFRRFFKLSLILLGVSMIFRHLDATLPKYMERVFGHGAPYGTYYAIEPATVIFAVPFFATVLRAVPIYSCLIAGSLVASLSPFWLTLADRYWLVAAFVITLSLGESVYMPKVYQYAMEVSPNGNEATYSALGNAPLFAMNFLAGLVSGVLLERFVPETGPKQPAVLWGIVGAVCLTSPLLLVVFRNHVDERKAGDLIDVPENVDESMLALTLEED